jgi:sulfoxide reductase heme-binding subunit YedZ
LQALQAQKRVLGLGVFSYVLLHFLIYLVDRADLQEIVEDLFRVFLLCGLAAFSILILMALTSSNRKIRQLGAKRWKILHRAVYAAAGMILLHMLLKEKSDPLQAWLLFLPLAGAEILRLIVWLRNRSTA